jgi:hypothetical protein
MTTLLTTVAAALLTRYSYASRYRLLFMLDFLRNTKEIVERVCYCMHQSSLSRPAPALFRLLQDVTNASIDSNSKTSLSRSKVNYQHKIRMAIGVRYVGTGKVALDSLILLKSKSLLIYSIILAAEMVISSRYFPSISSHHSLAAACIKPSAAFKGCT